MYDFLYDGGKQIPLLNTTTGAITAAQTNTFPGRYGSAGWTGLGGMNYLVVQAKFTYVADSATSVKAYVQTSLDNGTTWTDIMCFAFTTSSLNKTSAVTTRIAPASQAFALSDAALSDNTIIQGVLGDRIRVQLVTVGTYGAGTILKMDAWARK